METAMKEKKRDNYISWDQYFMGVAALSAMRSKDPNTQVGACIVSQDNKDVPMMTFRGVVTGKATKIINTIILRTAN